MLLTYLKLAIRLLIRNPFFTLINVLGLSVGFAVFIVLWQHSTNELKSDQFHKDWERIYKLCVIGKWTDDGKVWQESIFGFSNYGTSSVLRKYAGMIEETKYIGQQLISEKNGFDHGAEVFMSYVDETETQHAFLETKVIYAEPNFFNFFCFPFVQGDPKKALKIPNAVVISEKTAKRYFGSHDPIGKTLVLNSAIPLQVTAVFKNLPENTHLDFDIALSTERVRNVLDQLKGGEWVVSFTYCKFAPGINVGTLQTEINLSSAEEITRQTWGSWPYGKAQIVLKPLMDVPFEIHRLDIHKAKSKYLLFIFALSSFSILIMAWINYINLTVASNYKRMKEVAARRTVGAGPVDLIIQFMVESAIVNIIALLLGLTLVQLFKALAELYLQFHIAPWGGIPMSTWIIISSILLAAIVVTGLYPALITLKRSPKSLFQSFTAKANEDSIIGILTTVQFSGALALIVWIFAIQKQLNFISNKNIGLNKSEVLVMDLPVASTEDFYGDIDELTRRASALPGVSGYTVSNNVSVDAMGGMIPIVPVKGQPGIQVDCNGGVDENFIPFYGVKLLAGRNFQPDNPSDRHSILISRGTCYRLGFETPEDAVGRHLYVPLCEIIGVFEDYTLRPLIKGDDIRYGGIPGIALTYKDFLQPDKKPGKISFRVEPEDFDRTIEDLRNIYSSVFPGNVFNWYFLNDQINNQYQSDRTARNQILFFSILASGICCLGMLGMITSKLVEKLKEIGIRKVLGAELHQICWVLLSTTIKQVIIATVIGIPLAYYLIQGYLEKFSERITLQWWHYAIPVAVLVFIISLTIGSVLFKAACMNPVDSLRYE